MALRALQGSFRANGWLDKNQSFANFSILQCEDIGAGLQGKRPQSVESGRTRGGDRPLNALHGAGRKHFGRPVIPCRTLPKKSDRMAVMRIRSDF